jgi:Secretion system C-terminal sorting domain
MKRKLFFYIVLYFLSQSLIAQKELWGIYSGLDAPIQAGGNYGNISKYDIDGENPTIIHEFDSINGYRPRGRLFQASNGKIYGVTEKGGNRLQVGLDLFTSAGTMYEYDLVLNKYRVVKYFDFTPVTPSGGYGNAPTIGFIEPNLGQLYGATLNRIYKYDINLETVTFYNSLPFNNQFGFELMKASDGNLYGTSYDNYCPTVFATNFANGCVVKFNMITKNLSVAHPLNCDINSEGYAPWSELVEVNLGKLIGITKGGGYNPMGSTGVLFEYNFITNYYTNKINLDPSKGFASFKTSIINGGNGKIYGSFSDGGAPQTCNPENNFGTLFEYTPATNVLNIKQYFNLCGTTIQLPKSLVKTSEGHLIGTAYSPGTFKWNKNTNTVTQQNLNIPLPINALFVENLIEICRKPSYQEFLPNTYSPEAGTNFSFNVQNNNATTYVWKKDTIILPTQTTGILNLPSITTNDTGEYTCTMTNECGETVTMPLNINVTNLATESIANYKAQITLFPNPTKGIMTLKFPENRGLKAINYKITNLLGQVISENDLLDNTKPEVSINTTSFANGVYQITLATDKGNWNGKFVKE